MLLLRPSPGECVDRQTILALKIRETDKSGADGKHFTQEHQALLAYLDEHWLHRGIGDWRKDYECHSAQLAQVNQSLWDLENEIRYLKALSEEDRRARTDRIMAVAFAIPEMNDVRGRLVAKINALFGIVSREKLYMEARQK